MATVSTYRVVHSRSKFGRWTKSLRDSFQTFNPYFFGGSPLGVHFSRSRMPPSLGEGIWEGERCSSNGVIESDTSSDHSGWFGSLRSRSPPLFENSLVRRFLITVIFQRLQSGHSV